MIKSPFVTQNRNAKKPLEQAIFELHDIATLVNDLKALKEKTQVEHDVAQAKRDLEHQTQMARIETKINEAHTYVKTIQKGDKGDSVKGDPGDAGISPKISDIVEAVLPHLPQPEKVTIDHKLLAKEASKLIKVPEPKQPEKIDYKKIVEMTIGVIQKDKLIKTEHISNFTDGLEQTLRPIRSLAAGFRGGGDVVAAGTGVSITTSNGVKTISTSGGGFTTLTATETPDGAITVFTFAGATAQPSFIIVDNTWLRASTKKGTVNWTWNAGLKQATFTIPPVDEVLGIV